MVGITTCVVGMADLTLAQVFEAVISNGITPVLLILFVWYFINRDKTRDEQLNKQIEDSKQEAAKRADESRKREDTLMADCMRREELLKQESEKREKLLKQESEKRENHLMINLDKMSASMEKTAKAMQDINLSLNLMQEKITRIENNMEIGGERNESGGSKQGKVP